VLDGYARFLSMTNRLCPPGALCGQKTISFTRQRPRVYKNVHRGPPGSNLFGFPVAGSVGGGVQWRAGFPWLARGIITVSRQRSRSHGGQYERACTRTSPFS
jgi:hypothetical protein